MTLSEFLLARIAEDEAEARQWPEDDAQLAPNGNLYVDAMGHPIWASRTRVLAECEAKRRIVENCDRALEACGLAPMSEQIAASDGPTAAYWRGQNWALKVLAAVYADHPDFDPSWRA